MKSLFIPLVVSHLIVALFAGASPALLSGVFRDGNAAIVFAGTATVLFAIGAACWWTRRLRIAYDIVEKAIATGERPGGNSIFDVWATQLQVYIQHWIDSAANSRQELREIEAVLALFDHTYSDSSRRGLTSQQVQNLLSRLGTDSAEILEQMVMSQRDVDAYLQTTVESFEEQSSVLIVAERESERIRQDAESNGLGLRDAQASLSVSLDQATEAKNRLDASFRSIEQIKEDVAAGESKVRLLREHTAEIAGLAHAIGEVSARTDVLALNASIESARTTDDGRGFSVVAEEIRKLAAEIASTSRDILDRVNFLDTETTEANEIIASGRRAITAECEGSGEISESLNHLLTTVQQISSDLRILRATSDDQLERTSSVMTTLHHVGETCEGHRAMLGEIRWKNQSFAKYISRLTDAVEPLLRSAKHGQHLDVVHDEIDSNTRLNFEQANTAAELGQVGQSI